MPIYEMICDTENCDYNIELMIKIAEYEKKEYDTVCPKCGAEIRQKIGAGNFVLKGGYWERNEYTNKSEKDLDVALKEHDAFRKIHDNVVKAEDQ